MSFYNFEFQKKPQPPRIDVKSSVDIFINIYEQKAGAYLKLWLKT